MSDDEKLGRVRELITAGRLEDALEICLPPANAGDAEAIYLLAVISHHGGLNTEAMNLYREAAKMLPERSDVLYNFGVFLRETDEREGAIEVWTRAVQTNPEHWQASYNLALALSDSGCDEAAVSAYRQSLDAKADNIDALYNMGNACFRLGRWGQAREAYDAVFALKPNHAGALANLGLTLLRCGEDEAAVAACRKAVARAPDDVTAHVNFGHALLAAGDWAAGFKELQWRWRVQLAPKALIGGEQWNGEDLAGGHLVLFGEQGHGDVVQFLRFVQMAREVSGAGHVSVLCHKALVGIAARVPGVDEALALEDMPHAPYVCAALMDLPAILWQDDLRVPSPPYIEPPRARTLAGGGLRIGLVWRGNPDHANDAKRSCALSDLKPIFEMDDVHVFALQWQGVSDEERKVVQDFENVSDLGNDFSDFCEAAEILGGLDVLISVDTAMAHMAGALGVETWVMLPCVSDWRWRGEDATSPWYPNVRQFQQGVDGDWCAVVERVAAALQLKAATRRADPETSCKTQN